MKNKLSFSMRLRIGAFYLVLILITISILVVVITDNQASIIRDNTEFKVKSLVEDIVTSLEKFSAGFSREGIFNARNKGEKIELIKSFIHPVTRNYSLFSYKGELLYRSTNVLKAPEDLKENIIKSITVSDFFDQGYYLAYKPKDVQMQIYIPLSRYNIPETLLYINYDIKELNTQYRRLINLIYLTVFTVILLHFIIGFYFSKQVFSPLFSIINFTQNLAKGKFESRIMIQRKDEFGTLINNINYMANEIEGSISQLNDKIITINEQKQNLEEMASVDMLTGVYNRRFLYSELYREVDKSIRYKQSLSLIIMDLDHFKSINDTYGHEVGDEVLKEMAKVVLKYCRKADTIGRYGGEEFIILLPSTSLENAVFAGEKIRKAIAAHIFRIVGFPELHLTSSFGVSSLEIIKKIRSQEAANHLVSNADKALYHAKENGRNRVEKYSEDAG